MSATGVPPTATDDSVEKLILDSPSAARLAETSREHADPFPSVAPSLLSADHIEDYVRKTGMIAPFHLGGGRKARLKKASYEGRIGSRVYQYDEYGSLVLVPMTNDSLVVPANSIVFVESGIDFRLPDYMAIRFNLQILHVHRGLLLGTGPLVDPGFWGKLCIPLHNLTDQPYTIPLDEGLIWIEFTKTTSTPTRGRNAMGEREGKRGFWNVEDLIRKAAAAPKGFAAPVAIRSSIPSMVTMANDRADAASKASEQAAEDASRAAGDATEAKGTLNSLAAGAGAAIALAIVGLYIALASLYTSYYQSVRSDIAAMQGTVSGLATTLGDLKNEVASMSDEDRTRLLESRIRHLEAELLHLRAETASDAGGNVVSPNPEVGPASRSMDADSAPSAADAVNAK